LDLCSGRGEWLELLQDGFTAEGVDANLVLVDLARQAGLTVAHGDLWQKLRQAPDSSLPCLTLTRDPGGFEAAALADIVKQSRRVLQPGGVLLVLFAQS